MVDFIVAIVKSLAIKWCGVSRLSKIAKDRTEIRDIERGAEELG
jgi:hypothetical protein